MKISQNVNEKNTKNTEDRGYLIIEGSGSGVSLFLRGLKSDVWIAHYFIDKYQNCVIN
jgi:hypothetical protein